jgi:hypothetical protein
MGWETGKRGGRYYTRSKKINGQVVREYVGSGTLAELAAEMDDLERQERDQARAAVKIERDIESAQEKDLIYYCEAVEAIAVESLHRAGYHKHKGQWRRRRGH